MDIGFTGTQEGMTDYQKDFVGFFLDQYRPLSPFEKARHGMCIGADFQFHNLCKERKIRVVGYPGINKYGSSPKRAECDVDEIEPERFYLERNELIVGDCDVLIATPKSHIEESRSGTWFTIRNAREVKRHLFIVLPNGNVLEENRR